MLVIVNECLSWVPRAMVPKSWLRASFLPSLSNIFSAQPWAEAIPVPSARTISVRSHFRVIVSPPPLLGRAARAADAARPGSVGAILPGGASAAKRYSRLVGQAFQPDSCVQPSPKRQRGFLPSPSLARRAAQARQAGKPDLPEQRGWERGGLSDRL